MLFDWFDTKEAALIGVKLADDLSKELAKTSNKHSKKEIVNRAKAVQNVFSQFDGFERKSKPNFYKKSKLANEFRWRLVEIGHDNEFIELMIKELLIYMKQTA